MTLELDDLFDDAIECWQCNGDGVMYSCFEEFACIDPEGGCDVCERRCDICKGKGGWPAQTDEPVTGGPSP